MNVRVPAEVFPPGEFLNDELEARGWTQTEFAEIIRRPTRLVNEIIAGKRGISPETASDIAAALGTSAQLWMNLETAYQLSKVPPRNKEVGREAFLRERFPVREMIKRGWIEPSKSVADLESSVLRYFEISDVNEPIRLHHAARRNYEDSLSAAQLAWIFRVRRLAGALKGEKYSKERLLDAVPKIEGLMAEPEEIRHVPRILADAGVRLVIVEPIPGSKIQGVCFWLDDNSTPVIGLSLKGDQIDRFWFNLWHEIEHVLRGDGKNGVVVDDFDLESDPDDDAERLANEAAANRCVPSKAMQDFVLRHSPTFYEKNMVGFSRLMKRHPGIIVGQIQKRTNRWDLFRKYQVRVRQIIVDAALTDGYGRRAPGNL